MDTKIIIGIIIAIVFAIGITIAVIYFVRKRKNDETDDLDSIITGSGKTPPLTPVKRPVNPKTNDQNDEDLNIDPNISMNPDDFIDDDELDDFIEENEFAELNEDNNKILSEYQNLNIGQQLKILVDDDSSYFKQIIYFIKTNTNSNVQLVTDMLLSIPNDELFNNQIDVITNTLTKITMKMMNSDTNLFNITDSENKSIPTQIGYLLRFLIDEYVDSTGLSNSLFVSKSLVEERYIKLGQLIYNLTRDDNISNQDINIYNFITGLTGTKVNDILTFLLTISKKNNTNLITILKYSYTNNDDLTYVFRMLYVLCNYNVQKYGTIINILSSHRIANYLTEKYSDELINISNIFNVSGNVNDKILLFKTIFTRKQNKNTENIITVKNIGDEIYLLMKNTVKTVGELPVKLIYMFIYIFEEHKVLLNTLNLLSSLSKFSDELNRYKYAGILLLSMNNYSISNVCKFMQMITNYNINLMISFMFELVTSLYNPPNINDNLFIKFIQYIAICDNTNYNSFSSKPTNRQLAIKYGNLIYNLLIHPKYKNKLDFGNLRDNFILMINVISNKTKIDIISIMEWLLGPHPSDKYEFTDQFIQGFINNCDKKCSIDYIKQMLNDIINVHIQARSKLPKLKK